MTDETFRPQKKAISTEEINTENSINPEFTNKEGGVKFSGKMPEELRKAIAQRSQAPAQSEMRVTGSSKLEELIAGIQSKGNVAYEEIKLPSLGKFYNGDDGPTDGVLHIRPMTGEEEEILATPRFVKRGQAINMIFNRCIQEKYDSSDFLTQDRTYLLIYLRGISYSNFYEVEVKDPETDQSFAHAINLAELEVDYCESNFSKSSLKDVLPVTSYSFSYRLATGRDEQYIQDYREKRAKNFDLSEQADDSLLFRTAHLLNDIEGLDSKIEIQTLLKKLPIQDVAYLRNIVNEPPFGVNTKVTVNNPYTLNDFEIELPLEANFFFPRARRKTSNTQA